MSIRLPLALAISASFVCLSSTAQNAAPKHFHERYAGQITWITGDQPQNVYLEIVTETVDIAQGLIRARGIEHYEVRNRCRTVDIDLTVELGSRRLVIVRRPQPQDGAQDSSLIDPLIAMVSPDFKTIVNDLADNPDQLEDFVFRAEQRYQPPLTAQMSNASATSARRMPGC